MHRIMDFTINPVPPFHGFAVGLQAAVSGAWGGSPITPLRVPKRELRSLLASALPLVGGKLVFR